MSTTLFQVAPVQPDQSSRPQCAWCDERVYRVGMCADHLECVSESALAIWGLGIPPLSTNGKTETMIPQATVRMYMPPYCDAITVAQLLDWTYRKGDRITLDVSRVKRTFFDPKGILRRSTATQLLDLLGHGDAIDRVYVASGHACPSCREEVQTPGHCGFCLEEAYDAGQVAN